MAVKKPTMTSDLTGILEEQGVDPAPTRADLVERVVEASDPAMAADVKAPKSVKVKSPFGSVVEVPENILDALLDSGYSKSK